ncbi:MAG: hypothetical protein HFI93_07190 [Lachnospiraceae bacterium]|nr:hypothetical protein [Lachnospiraceae bacterium]
MKSGFADRDFFESKKKMLVFLAAAAIFAIAGWCGSAESDSTEIREEAESESENEHKARDSVIAGDVEDQVIVLACSEDLPSVYHEAAALFAGEVDRMTDGRIVVEIKPVGKTEDSLSFVLEQVSDGSVAFALVSLADISKKDATVKEWLESLYPDDYEGAFRALYAGDLEFLNENFIYFYNSVLLSVCGGNICRFEGEEDSDPYGDIQVLIVNNDYWNCSFDELKEVFRGAAGKAADSTK